MSQASSAAVLVSSHLVYNFKRSETLDINVFGSEVYCTTSVVHCVAAQFRKSVWLQKGLYYQTKLGKYKKPTVKDPGLQHIIAFKTKAKRHVSPTQAGHATGKARSTDSGERNTLALVGVKKVWDPDATEWTIGYGDRASYESVLHSSRCERDGGIWRRDRSSEDRSEIATRATADDESLAAIPRTERNRLLFT